MAAYVNEHGRKPGRGIRPWLLIPKVIGVAVYTGGVSAAAVISWLHPDSTEQELRQIAEVVRLIMVFCAVPGLLVAILTGLLLFWQHPKAFAAMRWWKTKMAVLLIGIPVLHLLTKNVVYAMRTETGQGILISLNLELAALRGLLTTAALMMALIIYLGRHKPRLGQPVATVAQQRQAKENA